MWPTSYALTELTPGHGDGDRRGPAQHARTARRRSAVPQDGDAQRDEREAQARGGHHRQRGGALEHAEWQRGGRREREGAHRAEYARPPGSDGEDQPAARDRDVEGAEDVEGAVRLADEPGGGLRSLPVRELEGEVVHPGVEGSGEEPEDGEDTAPQCGARAAGRDPGRERGEGGPQQDRSGGECAVGGGHQAGVFDAGGELLGVEEVERQPQQDSGGQQQRSGHQ
ncbi:hypothetical protein [Streptomyces sp. NBC_01439]|uniref:hypothetical protein n=1 Tax=Streptomyces sp. NBC_01439 TaxID=2903867 RepID=UPI002E2BE33C|nr:hypothetical protein [Streptomyces sp. NBC_01439]